MSEKYLNEVKDDTEFFLTRALNTSKIKYIKIERLTPELRVQIAYMGYMAQVLNQWGVITALAKEYEVSRQFIYTLIGILKEVIPYLFSVESKKEIISKKELFSKMLSYRMEGRCSIEAISTLMKREDLPLSSVGTVSQTLSSIGELLPNSIKDPKEQSLTLMVASDEIFSKSAPILITVDPISSAILSIQKAPNRKGESWQKHYDELKENGVLVIGIVKDEGNGLELGRKESLPDSIYQVDTYHAIAHRLGLLVEKFDKKAYRYIHVEDESKDRSKHKEAVETSIELSDDFRYLYHCVVNELKPFKHTGEARHRNQAQEEIETALILMEELDERTITTEIRAIRKILPNLLNYFEQTQQALKKVQELDLSQYELENLCLAWQWDKALIKAKVQSRRNRARKERNFYQAFTQELLQERYETIKEPVYKELETIIQASSMVETINSLLRPYLNNSKNQVTQAFLNLFMFYHNHRRYRAGKRKGKTPMELLIHTRQEEDWIHILCQKIEEKEKNFFI